MLSVLLYSVFVVWAVLVLVALILCDANAQRENRARTTKTLRRSRQLRSRVAINARGV